MFKLIPCEAACEPAPLPRAWPTPGSARPRPPALAGAQSGAGRPGWRAGRGLPRRPRCHAGSGNGARLRCSPAHLGHAALHGGGVLPRPLGGLGERRGSCEEGRRGAGTRGRGVARGSKIERSRSARRLREGGSRTGAARASGKNPGALPPPGPVHNAFRLEQGADRRGRAWGGARHWREDQRRKSGSGYTARGACARRRAPTAPRNGRHKLTANGCGARKGAARSGADDSGRHPVLPTDEVRAFACRKDVGQSWRCHRWPAAGLRRAYMQAALHRLRCSSDPRPRREWDPQEAPLVPQRRRGAPGTRRVRGPFCEWAAPRRRTWGGGAGLARDNVFATCGARRLVHSTSK